MDDRFFQKPVLNSPYAKPSRHWELDAAGQPTQQIIEKRRPAEFITPIPAAKRRDGGDQATLALGGEQGLSTDSQKYAHTAIINGVRELVDQWRLIPSPNDWRVTPETARLLQHWRHHKGSCVLPNVATLKSMKTY